MALRLIAADFKRFLKAANTLDDRGAVLFSLLQDCLEITEPLPDERLEVLQLVFDLVKGFGFLGTLAMPASRSTSDSNITLLKSPLAIAADMGEPSKAVPREL